MEELCIVRRRKSESALSVAENLDHSLSDRRRNRAERASNRVSSAWDDALRGNATAPDDHQLSIKVTPAQADIVKPRAYFKVLPGGKADGSSVGVQRSENGEIAFNFYFKQVHLSKLFTASDVCNLLQVSKAFLARLVKTGKLKSHKVGRTRKFSLEDVFAHIGESLESRPKGGSNVF